MNGANLIPCGSDPDIADIPTITQILTVSGGAGFVLGEIGYIHTDDTVRKAINTSALAAYCTVMALGTIANGAAGLFLCVPGVIDLSGIAGAAAQALGYVGGTAGLITTTAPTYGTATWTKPVGQFLSATKFLFFADPAIQPQNNG